MQDTKQSIQQAALRLFAQDGYEAVSVREIAEALGMTKGALYRHYRSKRDIFDSILERMRAQDAENARAHAVPEDGAEAAPEVYAQTDLASILQFSAAQFRYWTEDAFASGFRRLLTLEQFRSAEMAQLYQQYIVAGPLGYMEDLFCAFTQSRAEAAQLALEFYAPMVFLYSLYDGAEDKRAPGEMLKRHLEAFCARRELQKQPKEEG